MGFESVSDRDDIEIRERCEHLIEHCHLSQQCTQTHQQHRPIPIHTAREYFLGTNIFHGYRPPDNVFRFIFFGNLFLFCFCFWR